MWVTLIHNYSPAVQILLLYKEVLRFCKINNSSMPQCMACSRPACCTQAHSKNRIYRMGLGTRLAHARLLYIPLVHKGGSVQCCLLVGYCSNHLRCLKIENSWWLHLYKSCAFFSTRVHVHYVHWIHEIAEANSSMYPSYSLNLDLVREATGVHLKQTLLFFSQLILVRILTRMLGLTGFSLGL